ncbi:zincin-like metallopeptidase domain-containing protein [Acidiferrobacter sp.]|uniref:ArdC family protein n=1 Tax=Acidiferrobacter sp. TaxID=1872107 RepID=UPI00261079E3|nr:zincin-like metallopeptidase domain-containing protein [Acidiferrobacter sp.]
MTTDIHQAITDQILAAMETARTTGRRLWDSQPSLPLNLTTGKPYSGINVLMLWSAALQNGYASPYWLTYRQADDKGGQVRKGEHGTHCVFYKPWESQETNHETGEVETKTGAVLKSFTVFNLDQIDNIESPAREERPAFQAIEDAERILQASPARIIEGGPKAFYQPTTDTIHLPAREDFISPEAFYSVALHEATHSTGHASRLARDFSGRFGDSAYAFEELIAELGSAFLNADLGIIGSTLQDHADYLANWIKILQNDKRAILTAAAAASKAHAFIKGLLANQGQEVAA